MIMDVKEHYDSHLAAVYSWMSGNFEDQVAEQKQLFRKLGIQPSSTSCALDLGSGHGIQSVALAKMGFQVKAVDFSGQLLQELESNAGSYPIMTIVGDIRRVKSFAIPVPELIVCAGDTIAHFASEDEIEYFISQCSESLAEEGYLVLSFRDYTHELHGDDRFIPVRSDESRIITCFLEYSQYKVKVTDILNDRIGGKWYQRISHYDKVRIRTSNIIEMLDNHNLTLEHHVVNNGMQWLFAKLKG